MTTAVGPERPDNPPHIHRADMLAALELMAITDPNSVYQVVLTPQHADISRFVGNTVDPETGDLPTVTDRVEVR